MGERYTVIAYGVRNPPPPGPDEHWEDWLSDLQRRGIYPDLVRPEREYGTAIKLENCIFEFEASYEAEPQWIGYGVWWSSDDYKSEILSDILAQTRPAEAAWKRLREIVQKEIGIDLGDGQVIISNDHT